MKTSLKKIGHGRTTTARLMAPKGPATSTPALLLVHGWGTPPFKAGSTYDQLQVMLTEMGYTTLLLALRGHEGATGEIDEVSLGDHLTDVVNGYNWLSKRGHRVIDGLGVSYGGFLLSVACGDCNFGSLLLRAPSLYPERAWNCSIKTVIGTPGLKSWRNKVRKPGDSIALSALGHWRGELHLVWSELDEQTPKTINASYQAAAIGPRRVECSTLMGATHVLAPGPKSEFFVPCTV
jgi:hypothetical protein